MRRMVAIGRARGLAGFQADVMAGNTAMLKVFERSGLHFEGTLEDNVYHLVARLAPTPSTLPSA
jgi:RimJ/RimL family protein N-acetyltransferase